MSERRTPAPWEPQLIPVLVGITYPALLIGFWGITSLILDRDVIARSDAGPLLGPAMAVAASIVTFIALQRLHAQRSVAIPALQSAVLAWFALLVVGAIGYSSARGDATWLLIFMGGYAGSPFAIGAGLLSGLSIIFLWVVTFRDRRNS